MISQSFRRSPITRMRQRIAAGSQHSNRELCRLSANGTYFLSYRDAADVSDKLNHQTAHTMTFALVTLGVIEIVNKGEPNPNGGKASEFRYLLSQSETCADEDDRGFDL